MRQIANPKRSVIAIPGVRKRCRDEDYLDLLNGTSATTNGGGDPSGAGSFYSYLPAASASASTVSPCGIPGVTIAPFKLSDAPYGASAHVIHDTYGYVPHQPSHSSSGSGGSNLASSSSSGIPTITVGGGANKAPAGNKNISAMPSSDGNSNSTAAPSSSTTMAVSGGGGGGRVMGPILRPLQAVCVRYSADEVDCSWLTQYNYSVTLRDKHTSTNGGSGGAGAGHHTGGKGGGKGSSVAYVAATGETIINAAAGSAAASHIAAGPLMEPPATANHLNVPLLEDGFTLLELHYRYIGYAPPAGNLSLKSILATMSGTDPISTLAASLHQHLQREKGGAGQASKAGTASSTDAAGGDSDAAAGAGGASGGRSSGRRSGGGGSGSKSAKSTPTITAADPPTSSAAAAPSAINTAIYGVPTYRLMAASESSLHALKNYWLIKRTAAGLHNDGLVADDGLPAQPAPPTGGKGGRGGAASNNAGSNSSAGNSAGGGAGGGGGSAKALQTSFTTADSIPSHRRSLIVALCRDEQLAGPHGLVSATNMMAVTAAGGANGGHPSASSRNGGGGGSLILATDMLTAGDELSAFADYAVPFMHRAWECPIFVQQHHVVPPSTSNSSGSNGGSAVANIGGVSGSGSAVVFNPNDSTSSDSHSTPTAETIAVRRAMNEARDIGGSLTRYATLSAAMVEELRQREIKAQQAMRLHLYQLALARRESEDLLGSALTLASDVLVANNPTLSAAATSSMAPPPSGAGAAKGSSAPPQPLPAVPQQLRDVAILSSVLLPSEGLLTSIVAEEEEW